MAIIKEMSKIEKAQDLAQQAHVGQTRKVSKQPYILHPFRVYQAARNAGLSKDAQILALLHDTYEDSNNKAFILSQIRAKFDEKMVKLIIVLSHDKGVSNYNDYVLKLAKKSSLAFSIKLLDMMENLKDNPSDKQISKYFSAIKYVIDNGIKIDTKILSKLKKINKSDIYI